MTWPLTVARLEELLAGFPKLTIGLLGDLFLDRYLEIDVDRRETSIETGLEAYQIERVRNLPGALGTILNNLAALGVGRLVPVTVIGADGHGFDLMQSLTDLPVDISGVVQRPDRLTPTYTKPICPQDDGTWRELNRLDVRSRAPLSESAHQQLTTTLAALFNRCDGWIVLDQVPEKDCGVVDHRLRGVLEQLTAAHPEKLVLIDSRMQLRSFRCGILKGNRQEFLPQAKVDSSNDWEPLRQAMRPLCERTGRPSFCTVGEQGMVVAWADGRWQRVDGFPVSGPIDVVGAGDAATSGIVATLLSGGSELEAATVGNLVASITVQQIGTTGVAKPAQLLERLTATTLSS